MQKCKKRMDIKAPIVKKFPQKAMQYHSKKRYRPHKKIV
ncbi:hypothetical protein AB406_1613 [Riemerella anatipestifer]|uniref:Uncharacterized protein n=1 Tax=Riemerella anatipestifer TaxID=34085 RepID=A0A1S7DTY0_RIEAN|nr:hypothetical protein AB406_1613 [Riemerella anatipestifer]